MTPKTEVPTEAEAELLAAKAELEAAPARALETHDEEIRRIVAKYNLRQIDVIRITGYSRETVRQAMDPKIRAAVRKAAEERLAAKRAAG